MPTVAVSMDVNYGIYGTAILPMCVLRGEKHYERCGICRLIHIVIFCLIYRMHYLCMMQSVNECCLLFRSVLIVTVTWFRLVLGTQFYMAVCHLP